MMQLRTLWRCFAYSNKTEAINIAGRKVLKQSALLGTKNKTFGYKD
jgi:hypothetical protein